MCDGVLLPIFNEVNHVLDYGVWFVHALFFCANLCRCSVSIALDTLRAMDIVCRGVFAIESSSIDADDGVERCGGEDIFYNQCCCGGMLILFLKKDSIFFNCGYNRKAVRASSCCIFALFMDGYHFSQFLGVWVMFFYSLMIS